MNLLERIFPWAMAGAAVIYFFVVAAPISDPDGAMHITKFAALPVMYQGRVQPFDTMARVNLMLISQRQTWFDEGQNERPAIEWLLDVMARRGHERCHSEKLPAFRVDDAKTRELLGLKSRPGFLYAMDEFADKAEPFLAEAARVRKLPPAERTEADRRFLELEQEVTLYARFRELETPDKVFRIENDDLRDLLGLEPRQGFRYGFDEFSPRVGLIARASDRASDRKDSDRTVFDNKVLQLASQVQLYASLVRLDPPSLLLVPPTDDGQDWQSLAQAEGEGQSDNSKKPAGAFLTLLKDYQAGNAAAFNKDVDVYAGFFHDHLAQPLEWTQFEAFFNHATPFFHCAVWYVFVFVLACLAWVGWSRPLNQAAFAVIIVLWLVHFAGLLARMYIQGRPPVTTLYSSAIFIGWGCVALLVVIERIYKNGIPLALAAVTGALTLILAVNLLEKQEDTLKPLQAVLDTNFWLATHVTCVSLGYTATLAAGCIGLAYVVLGVFTPWLNRRWSQETETVLPEEDGAKRTAPGNPWLDRVLGKALIQMLYGVFCFATLLSFTGTVLGGIWADQSWGRFWGWDPKENGAVLVVIMNALILHARWAGIIRDRGMAVLAVAGNMVVVWSWFGTNQLRIGLHSYGFNSDLVLLCRYVWTAHLAFLAIGLLPLKYWRSFRPTASSKPPRATRRKPVAVAS